MKFKIQILTLVIMLCASAVMAQPIIVGGYRTIANNDEGAVAAANFAVETQAAKSGAEIKLIAVKKAQQQIVAGRNYKLCLSVEGANNAKSTAEALVYLNLKQVMSLTSWTPGSACSGEAPAPKEQEPNTGAKEQEPNTATKPQEPNTVAKEQEPNTSAKPQEPNTAAPARPLDEPMAGGYSAIDNDSAEAVAAAKVAIAAKKKKDPTLKLVSIEHAEQQVVAGMNYALCLRVKGKTDKPGKSHLVHAVVYQDLKQKLSLTSFDTVTKCPEE